MCLLYKCGKKCIHQYYIFTTIKTTHTRVDGKEETHNNKAECPNHTCIIKATMRYTQKSSGIFDRKMYNRLLDECGDASITNSSNSFVEQVLKFFYNIPLMTLDNGRITEGLANGTSCRGLQIKLKDGCHFEKETWEGYIFNTISADDMDHMICNIECCPR